MSDLPTQQVGSLQIEQDLVYQHRAWRLQRFGWAAMLLVFVAALLGLFGGGFLSQGTAQNDPALRIEYERFGRLEGPQRLKAFIHLPRPADGRVTLWLDHPYLEGIKIDSITPTPEAVRTGAGKTQFIFRLSDLEPAKPNQDVDAVITFDLQPQTWGRRTANLGILGGSSVQWSEFVYP